MSHAIDTLFLGEPPCLRTAEGQRSAFTRGSLSLILDTLGSASCLFVRAGAVEPHFHLDGDYHLSRCPAGGWVLQGQNPESPAYWIPAAPTIQRVGAQGHILETRVAEWDRFELDSGGVTVAFSPIPTDWSLDMVIWRLEDAAVVEDLSLLAPIEAQGYFLLGSHSRYGRPADLYRHLIHGWVYEDRYAWPHKRRICSENDAHALHLISSGLGHATGKRVYGLLKTQILLSVLFRQSEDGGFRHGEWTDDMESHYRLHNSALHLMMDALSEHDDPVVRAALTRGIAFISDKHDATQAGAWFYHDELETREATMRRAPFKWWPSKALGKSPQNMLVLNTQLDTLVALDRYSRVTGDVQYAPLVESGYLATRVVLELRPVEWLYRLVFSAIDLTLLPTERAARLPLWQRLWKRIGWQVFVPRLPRLKTRFPRLVMPGGYIDRELSLQTWAYDYLAVNLMDLVRAAHGLRAAVLMPYIEGILAFCARTGIAHRWLEHKGRAYAVGFYAEALVLLGIQAPRPHFDALLAEALLLCVHHNLGLPPSLIGGNAEAQAAFIRVPQPIRGDIIVANLSRPGRAASLVVNAGQHAIRLDAALRDLPEGWSVSPSELHPGSWIRLEA